MGIRIKKHILLFFVAVFALCSLCGEVSAAAEVDVPSPSSISVRETSVKLKIGETYSIDATVVPEAATQLVTYKSSKTSVASVSGSGVITAKKVGSTKITVHSAGDKSVTKTISVVVAKLSPPKKLVLTPAGTSLYVGEPLQLTAVPSPSTAASGVKWSTSNSKIAKVSKSGLVTPLKAGKVRITATSTSKSSVKVSRSYTVTDPYTLTSIKIDQDNLYLDVGEVRQLSFTVVPKTAIYKVTWKSSKSSVVSVDKEGKITAKAPGSAILTVKSGNKKTSQIIVAVLDKSLAITEPARNTPPAQLDANLKLIDDIRLSACLEIESLEKSGKLSSNSAALRKTAIENAFTMYRFPWTTDRAQNYWSSKSPSKAYKTGVIYYGLPYIQRGARGNDANRRFTVERAVSGGYFVKSGSIYKMSHQKKLNGTYVGNDCSSFVNMSIFGTSHAASFYRTTSIAKSPYYKTIKGDMLPGDLLVKSGLHTVMFLYYTNSAKTHMMIIEQGGGAEPNTIASRHKEVTKYTKNGYIIRRPTRFN